MDVNMGANAQPLPPPAVTSNSKPKNTINAYEFAAPARAKNKKGKDDVSARDLNRIVDEHD